jgi:Xaa-Pro aminopeptidase
MYFPKEEYERRWRRVAEEMARRGIGAAVVWGRSGGTHDACGDILWLTNYYAATSGAEPDSGEVRGRPWTAAILADGEPPELHVPQPVPPDLLATDRVEWHFDVVAGTAEAIRRKGIRGRVALVGEWLLPLKYGRALERALPDVTFVPEDDLVMAARRVKGPRELECYREAGTIVSVGLGALMEGLVAGESEAEAAASGAYEILRRGGNYHMMAVTSGPYIGDWTTEPLNGYSLRTPAKGELVRGWLFGPIWQGYWLDPGRTAVAGRRPTAAQRDLIADAIGIVDVVIGRIRPGARVSEVAEVGERMRAEASDGDDVAGRLYSILGHGVGMGWEGPDIASGGADQDSPWAVFEEGMVLGVETFVTRKGVGSAGFEQNVIVGRGGTELLTTTPTVFW